LRKVFPHNLPLFPYFFVLLRLVGKIQAFPERNETSSNHETEKRKKQYIK
jgi:hypothetical protein